MSTQFFTRQEAARVNTFRLLLLFLIAVVGLVGTSSLVGYLISDVGLRGGEARGVYGGERQPSVDPFAVAAAFGGLTAVVIVMGTLYQVAMLRHGGGARVAESLGGRQLSRDTRDPAEKRLLNVVEEMAIASGTPVPPVYLLDEPGINAFAAGYLPGDAVLGITRGAIDRLNRDELQGVIAHEFSHVLNGDMRMSIRMIGVLHGILLLSLIGQMLLRSIRHVGTGSRDSNKGSGGMVLLLIAAGVGLLLLGAVGSFVGGLIKASISRQREYLADASAVQFTRNPPGLAGALRKIGALAQHGRINHRNAGVASHMYFAQGVFEGFTGLLATHPPLEKRIRAIDPSWDGEFAPDATGPQREVRRGDGVRQPLPSHVSGLAATPAGNVGGPAPTLVQPLVPVRVVMSGADQVGEPELQHRRYAAALLKMIDQDLIEATAEPYSARALVFALLIDKDEQIRQKQFLTLEGLMAHDVVEVTRKLVPKVRLAPDAALLPLVDLALPMLRMMTISQYTPFIEAFRELVKADNRLTVFEWTLSQVLMRNLRRHFVPAEAAIEIHNRLSRLVPEVSVLFSVLARAGTEAADAEAAFAAGISELSGLNPTMLPAEECNFRALDKALAKLAKTAPRHRQELLRAAAAIVCHDQIVRVKEAELLRGIADLLDCPMPPMCGERQLQVAE